MVDMQTCWRNVIDQASFAKRVKAAEDFNKANRFRKRGVAVIPTKFGISFTTKFLNQAGSLVHVYTDGTVLVTHGGVEMGQGLHTKVAQVGCPTTANLLTLHDTLMQNMRSHVQMPALLNDTLMHAMR